MHRTLLTHSDEETRLAGASLAAELFAEGKKAFLSLIGPVGAGKSTFARGFIAEWCRLSGVTVPDSITSPTYNIARTYSEVAHLDLYRLRSMNELEQLGFEHYFYDFKACLVEWADQIPEVSAHIPEYALTLTFETIKTQSRKISF